MHAERTALLLDVLKKVDPKEFDMAHWTCGTAACAAGHLCLDPRAQAQGLTLENDCGIEMPYFQGAWQFSALAEFFEITRPEAEVLFHSFGYGLRRITPNHVSREVRKMYRLKRGRPVPKLKEAA